MTSTAYHHIALTCSDLETTERFYSEHFGFERARVIPVGDTQIVFIKSGGFYLELIAAEEASPIATATGDGPLYPGMRHLAFRVDDVDAKLAEMGDDASVTQGPLDFDDFIPGWRTVWVSDPDGNIVEISQGFVDQENPPQA